MLIGQLFRTKEPFFGVEINVLRAKKLDVIKKYIELFDNSNSNGNNLFLGFIFGDKTVLAPPIVKIDFHKESMWVEARSEALVVATAGLRCGGNYLLYKSANDSGGDSYYQLGKSRFTDNETWKIGQLVSAEINFYVH